MRREDQVLHRRHPGLPDRSGRNAAADEATTALVMLGFSKANINKVMPSILKQNPAAKVEDIIKAALQKL